MISVHVEVLPHLHRTLSFIKSLGAPAGVGAQPVDAGRRARGGRRRCRLRARDVGQPRVRRPGLSSRAASLKIRSVRALLDRAGNPAPIEVDGGIDLDDRRPRRRGRRARSSWPGRPSSTRRTRSGHARAEGAQPSPAWPPPQGRRRSRRPDAARCPEPPHPRRDAPRPRAVRRDRQDGRRLLRELPGLVRGRPLRVAARARAGPTATMEARRDRAARDRGALRVPAAAALRRRARDPDARRAARRRSACEFDYEVVRRGDGAAAGASGHTVHAAIDRARPAEAAARRDVRSLFRMKALVTGVAGFIGSHLAERLLDGGARGHGHRLLHRLLPARDQGSEPRRRCRPARVHGSSSPRSRRPICAALLDGRRPTSSTWPRRRACARAGGATSRSTR